MAVLDYIRYRRSYAGFTCRYGYAANQIDAGILLCRNINILLCNIKTFLMVLQIHQSSTV